VVHSLIRRPIWRVSLSLLRLSEVAARISVLVILQSQTGHFGSVLPWWIVLAILGIDLVVGAVAAQWFGVARKPFPVLLLSIASLVSNVHFFSEDVDKRRFADFLNSFRLGEFTFLGLATAWYAKFAAGGTTAIALFATNHTGVGIIMVSSLALHFVLLVIWLEIRRAQSPKQWDNQDQRSFASELVALPQ